MNIYLDFEATQYKANIIAIGATCKWGNFEMLVKPPAKDKVSNFITNLTGITRDMVAEAQSAEDAFRDFYDWVKSMIDNSWCDIPFFHVFGDMDKVFLQRTARHIEDKEIRNFVINLAESVIDDSPLVRQTLHVKSIGVHNALKKYEEDIPDQNHHALDDAILLKKLMEHIMAEDAFTQNEEEIAPKEEKIVSYLLTDAHGNTFSYSSKRAVVSFFLSLIKDKHPTACRKNIKKKVNWAINHNTTYHNFTIVEVEG